MFNKKVLAVATGAALMAGAHTASAGVSGPQYLDYSVTIEPSCTVATNSTSFGSYSDTAGTQTGLPAGSVQVTCSAGASYVVAFDGGVNGDGLSARYMANTADPTITIGYDLLYGTTVVGDADATSVDPSYTSPGQPFAAAGITQASATGSTETYSLTADVYLGDAGGAFGTYTDSVGVSVVY